jgi:hypothetical protein
MGVRFVGDSEVPFLSGLGAGRFAKIGIPAPAFTAPFVGVVEIIFVHDTSWSLDADFRHSASDRYFRCDCYHEDSDADRYGILGYGSRGANGFEHAIGPPVPL